MPVPAYKWQRFDMNLLLIVASALAANRPDQQTSGAHVRPPACRKINWVNSQCYNRLRFNMSLPPLSMNPKDLELPKREDRMPTQEKYDKYQKTMEEVRHLASPQLGC